jgi:hypothetical protein
MIGVPIPMFQLEQCLNLHLAEQMTGHLTQRILSSSFDASRPMFAAPSLLHAATLGNHMCNPPARFPWRGTALPGI